MNDRVRGPRSVPKVGYRPPEKWKPDLVNCAVWGGVFLSTVLFAACMTYTVWHLFQ